VASRRYGFKNVRRNEMLGSLKHFALFISNMSFEKLTKTFEQQPIDRLRTLQRAKSTMVFANSIGE